MKMKKIFAGVVAAALAVSTMAFAAFAENVGDTEDTAEPVELTLKNAGKMVDDHGIRVNLSNPYVGEEDVYVVITPDEFAGTQTVSVKFKVENFDVYGKPFNAWLIFANNAPDDQADKNLYYWGADSTLGVKQTPIEITGNGEYVVTLTTDVPIEVFANFFLAVQTDIEPDKDDANFEKVPTISLVQVAKDAALVAAPIVDEPTKEPTPSSPGEPTDKVPDTGVTLAIVPAALAAAALAAAGIATKKRK